MELTTRTLGEICDAAGGIIRTGPFGSQLHDSDYVDEGIPVVMPKNIIDGKVSTDDIAFIGEADVQRLAQHQLHTGDIVYGRRGDIGRRALITEREDGWLCGTGCLRISIGARILDPLFLYYYLGHPAVISRIASRAIGTTLPNLNTSILRSIEIVYPRPKIQRTIASILSAYDDLIEKNTRRIAILEEMARTLYHEWFVKFRFPGHEQVKMVESEMGMVPEGWEAKKFSAAADFVNGFAFKPHHWGKTGKPIVKIVELKSGITDSTPYYEGADLPPKYHVENGDLLFSWSADLDAYIWNHGSAFLNQHLFKVCPYSDFTKIFLFFSLKERMDEFRVRSQGTTMRHIKRSVLDEVKFLAPPKELRELFEQYAEPILLEVQNLMSRNINLRRTRDKLLPKLISGEMDVAGWVEGEEGGQEVEEVVAASGPRIVRETGPVERVDVAALERPSLWE